MLRNQRTPEGGGQRVAVFINRTCLQGRQDVVASELLASVDDVGAYRADGERPLPHVGQILSLAEIERHRNDLGGVLFGQPGNRHRRVESARICKYDSSHRLLAPHAKGGVRQSGCSPAVQPL